MNETLKRSISGAVYIILLVASILYSTESFFILFGIFLIIAVTEFSSLTKLNKIIPIILALLVYSSLSYLVLFKNDLKDEIHFTLSGKNYGITDVIDITTKISLAISILAAIKGIVFLFSHSANTLSSFSKYAFLLGYLIFPFIMITKIPFGEKGYNPKILISIFILIWTNDTFAYVVGKSIGKHKLFERISPKKTIEGFVGGVIFAIVAGFLISKYYFNPSPKHFDKSVIIWTITAFIVSFFGTIGDLIESKFKRIAGVKDSGNIMPGDGGVLDRLDSIIFAAPFVFLFYQILNYVTFS
ncbi:phosphatidate cytidylyltransferase [Flavobacterium sp. 3HN19-14]|uniref:phosphatidate cytidylyltransferase n=1 Tax=Flavobacterium sp. 3HN19-14 TaxID=3448133 RepID=UPI003EE184B0